MAGGRLTGQGASRTLLGPWGRVTIRTADQHDVAVHGVLLAGAQELSARGSALWQEGPTREEVRDALATGDAPPQWASLRAAAAGRPHLRLDVDPDEVGLRAFYERAGFVAVGMSTSARWPAVLYEASVRQD